MCSCAPPPDVSLLLLAHSEQALLSSEVLPVVRQLETGALPAEQLPAAAAYLEVVWAQAAARARAADAALGDLDAREAAGVAHAALGDLDAREAAGEAHADPDPPLPVRARRYHASVRALREALARRVAPLLVAAEPAFPTGYAAEAHSA